MRFANMKILLLLAFTVLVRHAGCCLKGWDVVLAIKEDTLNKAYIASIVKTLRSAFPSYTHKEKANIPSGQPWGTKNSIIMSGIKISKVALRAVPAQDQVGKLEVSFSSGTCTVHKEIVKADGSDIGLPPSKKRYLFSGQTISFRVRVTSYKISIGRTKKVDRYSIKLIIVEDDAIIGNLEWKDLSVFDNADVRKALSTLMQRALGKGSKFDLGVFDLPKVDNTKTSLVKDLFPKQIRFAFIWAPNGQSIFAALTSGTNKAPGPSAFHWTWNELISSNYESTARINSEKVMAVLKKVISDKMKIPWNNIRLTKSCPQTMEIRNTVHEFSGTDGLELKKFEVTPYYEIKGTRVTDNQLQVVLKMWKNVMPGMDVDIYVTLRFRVTYNHAKKKFDVTKSHEDIEKDYHRKLWVIVLEIVTLGLGRLVTLAIQLVADSIIGKHLSKALNFDTKSGGLPVNVGGPLKNVFDQMWIKNVAFDSYGSLVFNFAIKVSGFLN